jgi:hypothetical protein
VPPKAAAEDAFNVYHRAFHGTGVDAIAKILREGSLMIPGGSSLQTDTVISTAAWMVRISFAKIDWLGR